MKTINVKAYNTKKITKELAVVTNDGQPTIIKAEKGINYEFFDQSIGRAPNHIITKRSGKDLHLSFERDGKETDLIIEGFYDNEDHALIGIAEDGQYYYYIPDTGEVSEYVTQLVEGRVEGQALGGEHLVAPWWVALPHGAGMPWWLGLVAIPVAAFGHNSNDHSHKPTETAPNTQADTVKDGLVSGQPVTVNVLANDSDAQNDIDPTTVKLIDPATNTPATSVTIANQGTWSVDAVTGAVTFTPVSGFTGDPTPISYTVADKTGLVSDPATITVDYPPNKPVATNDTIKPTTAGTPVTVDVLGNDSDAQNDIDPTTVKLIDPATNTPATSVTIANQGTWSVDAVTGAVTFTPVAGFTGDPTPISYTVADKTGLVSDPATITLDYPQDKPTAVADTGTGATGQPVKVDVLANDSDVQNDIDPTTVKLIDPATNTPATSVTIANQGTWSVDAVTGAVTFTPVSGFTGDPTPISYTVADKTGLVSDPATITLDYPQDKPAAVADTGTGATGQPVTVDVLANDSDVQNDIDPTTVKLIDPATNTPATSVTIANQGTWSVDAVTGAVTFTPVSGFTGDPTPISYTVTDKTGLVSDPATITLDYPQDKPAAVADTRTGATGQPVTVNVLANDTDAQNDIDPTTVKLIDPATNTPATSVTIANQGTWSVDAVTGAVTFTPVAGFTGDPTPISYTVTDKTGLTSDPVSITLDYPQDKPAAVADTGTGATGQPVIVDVLANDSDVQNDIDPTTVKLIDPATNTPATSVTIANQGTWSVDAVTGAVTFTPVAGFTGDPTPISYTVTDKTGLTSDPVSITLDYPQDKPTAVADTGTGATGQPVKVDVLANDSDVQNDIDPTTVKLIDPATNTPATSVTIANQGTWSVDAVTGAVTFTPVAGFTGDPTPISYTVTDKTGLTSDPVSITLDYPQDKPTAVADTGTGATGQPVTVNVLANDSDVQNDIDPTTVKLIDPATNTPATSVTIANQGTWSVDAVTGAVTFTPVAGFTGDPTPISYTVTDKTGLTSDPVSITLDYPQDKPTAVADTGTGATGQPVTVNVLANDSDVQNDIDPTTVKLIDPATNTPATSVTIANQGTWSVAADGKVTFTPVSGFTGDPTPISYTVKDSTGLESNPATITLDYPQDKPAAVADTRTGATGQPVTVNVLANDSDVQNDIDPTTVKLIDPATNTPATSVTIANQGTWSVDAVTGAVTFTPVAGFTGDPTPISYTVADKTGLVSDPATITLDYPQDKPAAVADTGTGATGQPVTVNVLTNDTDAQNDIDPTTVKLIDPATNTPATSVTIANQGTWSVDAVTGAVTFTPVSGFTGDPTPISYTVADKTGLVSDPATITLDYPQDKPAAVADTGIGATGQPVTVNVLTNDTDIQNDIDPTTVKLIDPATNTPATSVTIANQGTWSVAADGKVTFTPVSGFTGDPTPISYTVADKTGLVSDPATITVDYPNNAPVAVNDSKTTPEDTPATGNVLTNDSDVDNDTLTVSQFVVGGQTYTAGSIATIANVGTLVINSDGNYTFTPAANYNGTVPSVTYTVSDGKGANASAKLDITVTPVNDAPVAVNDSKTTPEDTPATGNVLTNDSDVDNDTLTVSQFVVGGQTYTAGSIATIANVGTLVINSDGNYTFTPAANYNGTVPSVTYTVSDGKGANASAKLDITVTPVNDAPVAVNDSKTTPEDTPATGNVLTNDSDVDNDTLTVSQFVVGGQTYTAGSIATIANVGTLVINSDGNYTFTPAANYNGTVPSVAYTVSDGKGANASAKLDITVTPVNDAPVAVNDSKTTPEDTPATGNVLTNDSDVDNDTLTVSQFVVGGQTYTAGSTATIANVGTLFINSDGNYTFTPAANYNGTVPSVTYTVSDGKGANASAKLDITVTPVNDAPVAVNDSKTTAEDTPATGNVLTNDSDVDNDTLTVSQFVVGGQTYTAGSTATIANVGTLFINSDGNYTFTPAANYNGTVPSVTYTVSDGKGANASAKLDITVTPVNDVPVAVDDTYSIAEDAATPLTLNPLNGDTDIDGDNLTITAINGTNLTPGVAQTIAVTNGTVNVAADGTITFSPAANYNGTVTIPYTISDGKGANASAKLDITVTPVNDAPVAVNDSKTTPEDTPATGNVLTNDSDVDNDTLTVSQFVVGGQTYTAGSIATIANVGTLVINSDGNYTFTPAANYNGTVPSVTYTVSDGKGANASAKLDITVTPVNDVPVAVDDSKTTAEDTPATGNVLTNDSDVDNDTLTVSQFVVGGQTYTAGSTATIANVGTLVINSDGNYTFTPAANYNGTVPSVTYTVSDGKGANASAKLDITVTPVNDAPVAVNDSKTTPEDTPATGNVLTNDSDVDNDTLTVSQFVVGGQTYTAGSTATIANVGTLFINSDGNYTFTPAANYNGTVPSVTYTVSDGKGANASAKLDITVTPVNDVPVAVDDTYSIAEDAATPLTLNPLNGDTDIDGDNLTITAINGTNLTPGVAQTIAVTNGTVNVAADGTITFSPAANYNGTVTIPYTISDGKGGTATANEIITVTPVNDVPVAVDDSKTTAEDTPATGNVLTNDSDVDNDTLTVSQFVVGGQTYTAGSTATIANVGTLVINSDGNYTFTPAANYNGTVPSVTYTVSDGKGANASAKLDITVTPVNDVPVAVDDIYNILMGHTVILKPLSGDTDSDNDTLRVSQINGVNITGSAQTIAIMENGVQIGTVNISNAGVYSFTPASNYFGQATISYQVSDGYGGTSTANEIINVTAPPDAIDDSNSISLGVTDTTPITGNVLTNDTDLDTAKANLKVTTFTVDLNGNGITEANETFTFAGSTTEISNTVANVGTFVMQSNGDYTFTPVQSFSGNVPKITYTVSDGTSTDTANLLLRVDRGQAIKGVAAFGLPSSSGYGFNAEYYGYTNYMDSFYPTISASPNFNPHTDDNTYGNLGLIATAVQLIDGRNGIPLMGTANLAADGTPDVRFKSTSVNYWINASLGINEKLPAYSTTVPTAAAGSKIAEFLSKQMDGSSNGTNDASTIKVEAGLGATTDAAFRMTGMIYLKAGTYDFRVLADDGARLTLNNDIDNSIKLDELGDIIYARTAVGSITLNSDGFVPLEFLYYDQGAGGSGLRVEFKNHSDSTYQILDVHNLLMIDNRSIPTLSDIQDVAKDSDGIYKIRTGALLDGYDTNDSIIGTDGKDHLMGGKGDDTLAGGAGADKFIYSSQINNGHDVITDFTVGTDKIALSDVLSVNSATIDPVTKTWVPLDTTTVSLPSGITNVAWNDTSKTLSFDTTGGANNTIEFQGMTASYSDLNSFLQANAVI